MYSTHTESRAHLATRFARNTRVVRADVPLSEDQMRAAAPSVSKAQIVQELKEAGPDLATDGVESMKKDVLVNTALARLKGTRWLPVPLRPSSA